MKEYGKRQVFKEKATLTRKEQDFQKSTASITNQAFLSTFTQTFDAFHITTRKTKKMVPADLRKIYARGQDYSPKVQAFRDTINFWKRIVK